MREKGKGARANPILKTLLCLFGSGMPLFLAIVIALGWSPKTTVLISKLIAVVFLMTVVSAYGYPVRLGIQEAYVKWRKHGRG